MKIKTYSVPVDIQIHGRFIVKSTSKDKAYNEAQTFAKKAYEETKNVPGLKRIHGAGWALKSMISILGKNETQ